MSSEINYIEPLEFIKISGSEMVGYGYDYFVSIANSFATGKTRELNRSHSDMYHVINFTPRGEILTVTSTNSLDNKTLNVTNLGLVRGFGNHNFQVKAGSVDTIGIEDGSFAVAWSLHD